VRIRGSKTLFSTGSAISHKTLHLNVSVKLMYVAGGPIKLLHNNGIMKSHGSFRRKRMDTVSAGNISKVSRLLSNCVYHQQCMSQFTRSFPGAIKVLGVAQNEFFVFALLCTVGRSKQSRRFCFLACEDIRRGTNLFRNNQQFHFMCNIVGGCLLGCSAV
jgi:hypothetical protein